MFHSADFFGATVGLGAASLFGSLAVLCVLIWPFFTTRPSAILTQCLGAGAFAVHFLLIGSATAAAASCVALVQLLAVTAISRRLPLCLAFAASLVVLAVLTVATWHGWPSMLACAGSLLATAARLQRSMTSMKVGFLISGPFWAAHNVLVGSVFGMTIDVVSIGSNAAVLSRLLLRTSHGRRAASTQRAPGGIGGRVLPA